MRRAWGEDEQKHHRAGRPMNSQARRLRHTLKTRAARLRPFRVILTAFFVAFFLPALFNERATGREPQMERAWKG
jgi:hypothetical protein